MHPVPPGAKAARILVARDGGAKHRTVTIALNFAGDHGNFQTMSRVPAATGERNAPAPCYQPRKRRWRMRGVLLWALGIPIPVIILLYVFHVI
jgi:hypothetical protein